ncbi:MAG: hypothetical protein ABIB71_09215 [Candidatus Woesearchaeota archaeon]
MPPPFWHQSFGIDIAFGIVISVICFLVYFRTKELYNLSSHKGIKYFSYAFLFFGLSFFVKLLLPISGIFLERSFLTFQISGFIMGFLGIMAMLCLIYSLLWKRFRERKFNHVLYLALIALLVTSTTLFGRARFLVFLLQALLFSIVLIISLVSYRGRKKVGHSIQLHVLYILLAGSLIANVAALFASRLSFFVGLTLHATSIILFLIILCKVIEKTGKNGKKKG